MTKVWGPHIDATRITALWISGAKVNADKYLAFQRQWRNNQMVPEYLRKELPLDAGPALNVHDSRAKAVFAMAPGDIQGFGMDEAGLRELNILPIS
jgi:predicted dienelactone hydrolase